MWDIRDTASPVRRDELLDSGWEPYAVGNRLNGDTVWYFRIQVPEKNTENKGERAAKLWSAEVRSNALKEVGQQLDQRYGKGQWWTSDLMAVIEALRQGRMP